MQGFIKDYKAQRLYDIVIAADSTNEASKQYADFVCEGEHDEAVINQAYQTLYEDRPEGWTYAIGKILLMDGDYHINNPINPMLYAILEGQSQYNTYIYLNTSGRPQRDYYMIESLLPVTEYNFGEIRNLSLVAADYNDWNFDPNCKGIAKFENRWRGQFERVWMYHPTPLVIKNTSFWARWLDLSGDTKDVGVGIDIQGGSQIDINGLFLQAFNIGVKADVASSKISIHDLQIASDITTPINNASASFNLNGIRALRMTTKYQNKGVAAIAQGATTIVINHGLAFTPVLSQFTLTPDKNTPIFITNITATQFTINIPASVTGGVNIGWKVEY